MSANIEVNAAQLDARLNRIKTKLAQLRNMYAEIGEAVVASVHTNFDVGGRPVKWKPSRRALRTNGMTLVDTRRLRNSFGYQATPTDVTIGTNVEYAPKHHFGLDGMPARPFLMFQNDDREEIRDIVSRHLEHIFR